MTQVIVTPRGQADIERLCDFLLDSRPEEAARTASLLADALAILEIHPEVGRPYDLESRELVISRGRSGYLALYHYDEVADIATVMAIRHQREAGYH
ncbi:type II toxin-antitoxin system RelE/ParE family toxin [Ramlibacter sp.]|uniref:type II toxin-antitoxin system RelE/ParE family toxin n=1 Tax=Ramlibacter sp. TaxID=1917967 RepID=UPI003D09E9D6